MLLEPLVRVFRMIFYGQLYEKGSKSVIVISKDAPTIAV